MLTDERIEELILAGGGRWHDKSFWKIEDADLHPTARAIEAEVRKQDEALIRKLVEALETCNDGDGYNGPYQYYETVPVEEAVAAARARLLEADLAKLTERGAVAWPGIDAQDLRDGSKP